jgi:hypothetical protein
MFYGGDNFGDVYDLPKYNSHFPVLAKHASYFSLDETNVINTTT